ncbi:ATP-dependent zinc metalloprotease FtsH [Patescibacteria group bacterium]|nr:ATP-dependent zinc metalloprotease FtsH [Patescibacteria group bacterium]MBU4000082.1 ATP-dependent zinc metalloprotease FtsH [Patescibacteria group bacterium]MBU4056902.1 ATP-dependent zinc metalloprotease FtsH [Patescibacteria group bacterium]MBU4368580.1 ATP-dependent zinc metalloprotease FtsH [Patescibacteria group bacterium]
MNKLVKNLAIMFLVFLIISGIFSIYASPFEKAKQISLSELVGQINEGKVGSIKIAGNNLEIVLKDGTKETSLKEQEGPLTETLKNYGVAPEKISGINISVSEGSGAGFFLGTLVPIILPFLLIVGFIWLMLSQLQRGNVQAMSFGQARARIFGVGKDKKKVSFKDVAGVKEAKEELREIVEFLRTPKKFIEMGARIPRGVLLMGAPGTGKTLLARAVAGEAGVPFFSISGSEFVEMFVGVGASRVRDLFNTAKKNAPAILFIDEIDAVGRQRGAGLGGGHDEREQTLNQILVEMDGFETDTNVIVMAATNRPDVLDPALLRPGRFDRRIILDEPDIKDREEILKIHIKSMPLEKDVNLRRVAERTPGFSGADLSNLANEAAILAARRDKKKISQAEFLESIEKVMLGPERRSHILNEREKKIAAYHEAGHALVSASLSHTEPVHKISIISRGRAAGYTLHLPVEDKHLRSRSEFIDELAVFMGGFAAEKIVFDELTTGATNDLTKASELARDLVMRYGMSDKIGPITFARAGELVFLGRDLGERTHYSEQVASEIDKEVSKFIANARNTASDILAKRRKKLDRIATELIEKETIEKEKFDQIMKEK